MNARRGVVYEKSYALELSRIASEDLQAAQVLLDAGVKRKENIFLLAQQALEKALKALLCACELPVPHLHEISLLVDRLPDEVQPPFQNEFNSLTEYATIRRYLEGREHLDEKVIQTALLAISDAVAWCQQEVNKKFE